MIPEKETSGSCYSNAAQWLEPVSRELILFYLLVSIRPTLQFNNLSPDLTCRPDFAHRLRLHIPRAG